MRGVGTVMSIHMKSGWAINRVQISDELKALVEELGGEYVEADCDMGADGLLVFPQTLTEADCDRLRATWERNVRAQGS